MDASSVAAKMDEYLGSLRAAGVPQQAAVGHGLNTARTMFIEQFGSMSGYRVADPETQLEFVARMDDMAKGLDSDHTGMAWGVRLFWMYAFLLKDGDGDIAQRFGPDLERLGRMARLPGA